MLRPRIPISRLGALRDFELVEKALGNMLRAVFELPIRAVHYVDRHLEPNEQLCVVIADVTGAHVSLQIESIGERGSCAEHFSQLVKLAEYLHAATNKSLLLIPSRRRREEQIFSFSLSSPLRPGEVLGFVTVGAPDGVEVSKILGFSKENSAELTPSLLASLELSLECCPLPGSRSVLKADAVLVVGTQRFRVRMCGKVSSTELFLEKEDRAMTETNSQSCRVTLSLGELEISFAEALQLRPGMCIEFDRPDTFEALILLDSAPWAAARVKLDDRSIILDVEALLPATPTAPSENEATSETELRLVG